jgi:lipoprotein NlpD
MKHRRFVPSALCSALFAVLLAACATVNLQPVPIVERSNGADAPAAPITTPGGAAAPAAGAGAVAADGTYVVQRGDTLYSIALASGRDYRDLARWNNLDDPTRLKVGQALRVQPPPDDAAAASAPAAASPGVEVIPLGSPPAVARPAAPGAPAAAPVAAAPTAPVVAPSGNWVWPAPGKVIARFDDPRNKGIDIDGHVGDSVVAANDGTVVYSGNSLRGYGNLVIIKHSDDFISAYAHNRDILVTQGQVVKRGQAIAALGQSETDSPRLHFEIRRQGKPVDPARYLPPR